MILTAIGKCDLSDRTYLIKIDLLKPSIVIEMLIFIELCHGEGFVSIVLNFEFLNSLEIPIIFL